MSKTEVPAPLSSAPPEGERWTGWVVFASIMLVVIGALNIIQGLVALIREAYFVVPAGDHLLIFNYKAWGVVMLIWGAVQLVAGWGLNGGHGWGRVLAIAVACVSILLQTMFLSAFPIWSVIIIALDVIVVFALTARWSEAKAGLL
jgi:hypothetical protein